MEDVPDSHVAELLDELEPEEAASIVTEMDSDDQADLLAELDSEDVERILFHMDSEDAADARQLIAYPADTAGGLMMTEFISYPDDITVKAVIQDLSSRPEDYALYNVQYLYVLGKAGDLRGVMRLRDLVFGDPDRPVKKVMATPEAVSVEASMEALGEFFDDHEMSAVPAVDEHNKMVGVVRRRAVDDALAEKAEEDNLESARDRWWRGTALHASIFTRSGRRLSWLSVNVLLNILAASVIAYFQDTLSAVIALAVFLPIVSDMSGCLGIRPWP